MKNKKKQTFKKYIYLLLIIIFLIFISWYIVSWYNVKEKEKYLESYLISTNTVTYEIKNIDEIDQVLKEAPSDYFVYISYKEDGKVYKLEKELKNIIDDYDLTDAFYYVNVNNSKDNSNLIHNLNDTFKTNLINNIPCIIYFKDGSIKEIIQKENSIFKSEELSSLLENYKFEKISDTK